MFCLVFKVWVVFGWGLCCFAGERSVLLNSWQAWEASTKLLGGPWEAPGKAWERRLA